MKKIRKRDIITRNGVYKIPLYSPFRLNRDGIIFVFSSEATMMRFVGKEDAMIEEISESLSRRFDQRVDASVIAWFKLYRIVENRFNCIQLEEDTTEWPSETIKVKVSVDYHINN